jgi:hypothetical protein
MQLMLANITAIREVNQTDVARVLDSADSSLQVLFSSLLSIVCLSVCLSVFCLAVWLAGWLAGYLSLLLLSFCLLSICLSV